MLSEREGEGALTECEKRYLFHTLVALAGTCKLILGLFLQARDCIMFLNPAGFRLFECSFESEHICVKPAGSR